MIITGNTTLEFPSTPGVLYVFSASGTFGGGSISLQWSDGTEWVTFPGCALSTDGAQVVNAPSTKLRFLVAGTTAPNISANVLPARGVPLPSGQASLTADNAFTGRNSFSGNPLTILGISSSNVPNIKLTTSDAVGRFMLWGNAPNPADNSQPTWSTINLGNNYMVDGTGKVFAYADGTKGGVLLTMENNYNYGGAGGLGGEVAECYFTIGDDSGSGGTRPFAIVGNQLSATGGCSNGFITLGYPTSIFAPASNFTGAWGQASFAFTVDTKTSAGVHTMLVRNSDPVANDSSIQFWLGSGGGIGSGGIGITPSTFYIYHNSNGFIALQSGTGGVALGGVNGDVATKRVDIFGATRIRGQVTADAGSASTPAYASQIAPGDGVYFANTVNGVQFSSGGVYSASIQNANLAKFGGVVNGTPNFAFNAASGGAASGYLAFQYNNGLAPLTFGDWATGARYLSITSGGAQITAELGDFITATIGKTLKIKSGTNAKAGTFTLVAGTKTVANTSVTANSVIVVTLKTASGTRTSVPDIVPTAGTGFVATQVGASTDTSTYNYVILEVA